MIALCNVVKDAVVSEVLAQIDYRLKVASVLLLFSNIYILYYTSRYGSIFKNKHVFESAVAINLVIAFWMFGILVLGV